MKTNCVLLKVFILVLAAFGCATVFAADGVWTNRVSGSWGDAANWQSGTVAGAGGIATFNLAGAGYTVNNQGTVTLSRVTLNASSAGLTVNISGGTVEMVAPAVINASNSSYLNFKGTTLSSNDDLLITGLGRLFLGSDNLLSGCVIISNGNVRAVNDSAFGPLLGVLRADAITLDGGGLMNDADNTSLVISPNRGITLTANNGYISSGYHNAGTKINSPITGPGFLGINYEHSRVFLGNSANNYSGGTRIGTFGPGVNTPNFAVLVLDDNEVLPDAGGLMVGAETSFANDLWAGVLDLNGKTETVNTLVSGPRAEITSSVAGQGRLIVGGADDDIDYRGTLTGGATITKRGAGDIYLRGASLDDGTVEVEGGMLLAGGPNLGRATILFDGGDMRLIAPSGLYEYTAPSPNLPNLSADLTYTGWQLWPVKGSENSIAVFPFNTQFVYQGRWYVAEAGTYSFAKSFDDGGYLEIDGVPIIHNQASAELYVANNIAVTAGWHEIEIRFAQGGGGVGPQSGLRNGIMYDQLNGGFTSTVERARARLFTDDGGPHLIATGRDNVLQATFALEQDATLTVDAAPDAPVFAGIVTTNSVGAVEPTLTIDNNGAPVHFGSADALMPAVLDAKVATSGGLTLTDNLWLRRLPSAAYTLADGVNLFLDGNDLLGGALVLSNYSATVVAGTTIGGDGTATVLNGNTLSFSTLQFVDGALLDAPGTLLNVTTDFSLADSKAVFTGAGSMIYSGNFTGSGTIEKQGGGTVELTGAGSVLNGTIAIADGTLVIGSEGLLGGASVTLAGGVLSNKEGSDLTLNTTAFTALSGAFHVTSDETMTVNTPVIGSGVITKTGLGTLVLGGSEVNTGLDLTVLDGTLLLNKSGASDAYAVANLGVGSGATAVLAGSNNNQINGDVTLSGGTLELNGRSESISALRSVDAGSKVVNNGAGAGLTVGAGNGSSTFKGTLQDGSGALSLSKVGTGILTMAAEALAYTGNTDVNAGTLWLRPSKVPKIAGLSYQLDAGNPDTITLNGTQVSAWRDASGTGVEFTQTAGAMQPSYTKNAINGLPALKFRDNTRNRLAANTTAAAQTVFILAQTTSFGGFDGIWGNSGSDYGIRGSALGTWQHNADGNDFTFNGAMYINGISGSTYNSAQPYILTAVRATPGVKQVHALGDYWSSGTYQRYFRGFVGEVLVYDRALSAAERATVESYLSAKWFTLPAAGLAYRLDAANPSTITLDGTKVTTWADTTGARVDFKQANSALQPEYVSDALNGLPAVRFGGNGSRTRLIANKGAKARTLFIVSKMSTYVSLAGVWGQSGRDSGIRHHSATTWRHTGNEAASSEFSYSGEMYINGTPGFSFAESPLHILTAVSSSDKNWTAAIGDYWASPTYNRYFNGYIGEILVYDRVLTVAERKKVESFLAQKWLGALPPDIEIMDHNITVASGATLSLTATDLGVAALTGTGDLALEASCLKIADYTGFTGTVSGHGTVGLAAADGADATFTPMSLGVMVRNDSATAANVVVGGAEQTQFMGSMQDGKNTLGFVHSGSGITCMTGLNSTYTGDTLLEAGVASVGGAVGTRYVRFSPLAMRVGGTNYGSGYQLSEFQLMLNGVKVPYPAGTLGTSPGVNPGNEGPEKAIDGSVDTKFYIKSIQPLIVELSELVRFDGYRWYTANDSTGRDPLSWIVEISEDGVRWSTVDSRDYSANAGAITTGRKALAGTWTVGAGAMNVLSDLSRTIIAAPAELAVVSVSETIGPLSGEGRITLANGTLGLNAFESAAFSGNISGSGTIVKQGAAKQSLSGAINVIGEMVVEAGVLDLGGTVLTGITNIVIQAGGELTGTATVNGDLTITFAGGTYSGTLAVSSALTVNGSVTLALPEGAGYPLHQALFTYASADQTTQAALVGATLPPGIPTGYNAKVRVTENSARFVAAPAGILMIIR